MNRYFLLILMVPLSVFTSDMYLCSFKALCEDFSATQKELQMSLSVYFFGMAFFTLISPVLLKKYDPKTLLRSGLISHFAGTVMGLLAPSITVFILARFLQSFGGVASGVLTRQMASKSPSALTYMFVAMSFGLITAPLLGALFHTFFGWQGSFLFLAIVCAFYFVSTFFLQESENHVKNSCFRASLKQLFSSYDYRMNTLLVVISWCGFLSFVTGSPHILLEHFEVAPDQFSLLYSLVMLGFILGNFTTRLTTKALFFGFPCVILAAILYIPFFFMPSLIFFIGVSFLYMFGVGIILPAAQIRAVSKIENNPFVMPVMYFFMIFFGALSGTLVYGNVALLAIFMVVLGCLQTVFYFSFKR